MICIKLSLKSSVQIMAFCEAGNNYQNQWWPGSINMHASPGLSDGYSTTYVASWEYGPQVRNSSLHTLHDVIVDKSITN